MKKLCDLIDCSYDVFISGIADDSRKIKPGYLFVATKGFNVDHFDYIDEAINNGAVAIIAEKKVNVSVPVVVVENVNEIYATLCQKFFDINLSDFKMIGITGTDGKTTSASIIRELLDPSIKTAYIGTNGLEVDEKEFSTDNTTPCTYELFDCFDKIKRHNVSSVVMEVSSEALLHKRVKDLAYDVVAITNITEDHLNIHRNLENYIKCKLDIINYVKKDGVIFVNGDDVNCQKLSGNNIYKFGCGKDNDYIIYDIVENSEGVSFKIKDADKFYEINSPFKGIFNVYNITLAFLVGLYKKIDYLVLKDRISKLNCVKGRGEEINFGQDFTIVLDYAHTYNAISNILDVYKDKKLIVVTGAAGGREVQKRKKIGKLVLERAYFVIFTMDDPRYENVDKIIDDLVSDTKLNNYLRVVNRKEAIYKAFSLTDSSSAVLILGKGRDNYMAVCDRKENYSDYDVIREYFI